jgi:hypothetical protein
MSFLMYRNVSSAFPPVCAAKPGSYAVWISLYLIKKIAVHINQLISERRYRAVADDHVQYRGVALQARKVDLGYGTLSTYLSLCELRPY